MVSATARKVTRGHLLVDHSFSSAGLLSSNPCQVQAELRYPFGFFQARRLSAPKNARAEPGRDRVGSHQAK
jgi:hypothetical protein